jgi:hypothetical protein
VLPGAALLRARMHRQRDRAVAVGLVLGTVLAAAEDGVVLHLYAADAHAQPQLGFGDEGTLLDARPVTEGVAVEEEARRRPSFPRPRSIRLK